MSDNIPFDIQTEIFKRVPQVKSLLRFRAVSKPWKSFIDSSQFIADYGARDTQPQSLLLSYKLDNSNEVKYVSFVDDENSDTLTQQQDFTPNVTDLMKHFNDLKLVGSSNGLLCIYSRNKWMFVIWNPLLKIYVVALNDVPIHDDGFGFVVCPVTRDPTIIAITQFDYVYIFTLSSKRWTRFPFSNFSTRSISVTSHVVKDRCINWVVHDLHVKARGEFLCFDHMIISLDLISREIKVVDIPLSCVPNNPFSGRCHISKLWESLVLFVPISDVGVRVCCVWKMEHNASFTKLFTINTPSRTINNLLGFRKNGELVMQTPKEDEEEFVALEIYDPCTEHVSNLGIYGEKDSFFMVSYKETLLLMDHSDGCVYPEAY